MSVALAQDVYRRRLAVVSDELQERDRSARTQGPITIGDQWAQIYEVLSTQLAAQPEALDRVLIELANIRPLEMVTPKVSSARR